MKESSKLAAIGEDLEALAAPETLAWTLGGVAVGAVLALVALPHLAPPIAGILSTPQPKTWWHLSRASGLVASGMLSLSMLLGLLLSTRFAKTWPGSANAFVLHEHASALGLAAALFHAIVLLGDRWARWGVAQILLPFGASYEPLGVGLGQLALYGVALLVGSFYVRKRIGQRAWRWIHFASFLAFAMSLVHALAIGTDRTLVVVGLVPAAVVLFFAVYRVLEGAFVRASRPA